LNHTQAAASTSNNAENPSLRKDAQSTRRMIATLRRISEIHAGMLALRRFRHSLIPCEKPAEADRSGLPGNRSAAGNHCGTQRFGSLTMGRQ
jgi:hypothetical protein